MMKAPLTTEDRTFSHEETAQIALPLGLFGVLVRMKPKKKSQDVVEGLVDLVYLVCLFTGGTCTSARTLATTRASLSSPSDETDQINQTDQTPLLCIDYTLMNSVNRDKTTVQMGGRR